MVFFFQAEDGIRDWSVTGVQTCALPIFRRGPDAMTDRTAWGLGFRAPISGLSTDVGRAELAGRDEPAEDVERLGDTRSEERRVGKGRRCRRTSNEAQKNGRGTCRERYER